MQVALRAIGLYCGPIDGVVGPQTRAAVVTARRPRRAPGNRERSTPAPATRSGRSAARASGRGPITPGDFGLDVSVLQFLLLQAG